MTEERIDCKISPACSLGQKHELLTPHSNLRAVQGFHLNPSRKSDLLIVLPTISPTISISSEGSSILSKKIFEARDHDFLQRIMQEAEVTDAYITFSTKCICTKGILNSYIERNTSEAVTYHTVQQSFNPSVSDIKKCGKFYFLEELKRVRPKAILLLGNNALKLFNIVGKLTTVRGTIYEMKSPFWEDGPTFKVIPTLDPAFFYRNYSSRIYQSVVGDFRIARKIAEGENLPLKGVSLDYELLDTPEKLETFVDFILDRNAPFAFDSESFSLEKNSPVLCLSFSWGQGKAAILPILSNKLTGREKDGVIPNFIQVIDEEVLRTQLRKLFENEIPKIGHNLKYDYKVLVRRFGIEPQGKLMDTHLIHHLLNEEPPHDLEFLLDVYFRYGKYSEELTKFVGVNKSLKHYGYIPDPILWKYSAIDAEGVYRLFTEELWPLLESKLNLKNLYLNETEKLIHSLVKAELFGHKIDRKVFLSLQKEYSKKRDECLMKLKQITFPEFNPQSTPHRTRAIQEILANGDERTKNDFSSCVVMGKIKTGAEYLIPLADKGYEFPRLMTEYRKYTKFLGTYIEKILKMCDDDDFIELNWNIGGTLTGRLSCSVIHQIPKLDTKRYLAGKPVLRQGFTAPEGYSYVYCDASQIELRVFAAVTKDPVMLEAFEKGYDLHAMTASAFLGIPEENVNSFNRTEVGKRMNFGLIYGSTGSQLLTQGKWMAEDGSIHKFTWQILQEGIERWKEKFPNAQRYQEMITEELTLNNGVITTPFGRERHLREAFFASNSSLQRKALREAVNVKIQSTAASITYRVINCIDMILQDKINKKVLKPNDICLVNTVHDSIAYAVKHRYVDWFKSVLNTITNVEDPVLEMKFPFDIGVGKNWADAEMNSKE